MKSRRKFITGLLAGIPISTFAKSVFAGRPTPPETEGPFYPVVAQNDKDFDLTRISGRQNTAKGKIIIIQGQVMDTKDRPIVDAVIDLWQANAAGRYTHPRDPNTTAALDPDFQGWAIIPSGSEGRFRFKTIYPGSYPASNTWIRPPHIHFKVSKKGYAGLITQMYFPGHELNHSDLLLMQKSDDEIKLMTATKIAEAPETYSYNIILGRG